MDDTIKTGNVEGVGIAIGTGASVTIYGGVHYYPVKLRAPLRRIFDPLIADRVQLFSGRDSALRRIGEFIQDPVGGYLVLTAPAGFGKTALMAALINRTPEAFAYHFFSPVYGASTLSEGVFLRNIVEQMAEWHGYTQLLPDESRLSDLRALYHRFLGEPLEGTRVLVLDGLDEVTTWKLKPYVGRPLPIGLHVVLTIRDVGQDWRSEYGLPSSQTEQLSVGGLSTDGVASVLRDAGGSAAHIAEDAELLAKVCAIAAFPANPTMGADPFYVRLLAEDTVAHTVTPDGQIMITENGVSRSESFTNYLESQPRSLDGYFDVWWKEIRAAAGETPVRDLFGTLAVALGPIGRKDLERINPSLVDEWAATKFDEVVERVRRLVVCDSEANYVLAHPRLRDHLRRRLRVEPYQRRLLAYCRNWQSGSRYALAYVGPHLAESGDWKALRTLVATEARAFLEIRYATESSYAGFLRDLERLWQHDEEELPEHPRALGHVIRYALVASSVHTMSGKLAPRLLAAAVRHGIWPVAAAIEHANEIPDPVQRAEALAALLPQMSEAQRWRACETVIAAAKVMRADTRPPPAIVYIGPSPPTRDIDHRGDVLAPLAAAIPDGLRDDALNIVRSLERPDQIPILLTAIAMGMAPPKREAIFHEALLAINRIKPRSHARFMVPQGVRQARSLVAMSTYLEEPHRTDVLLMALDRAEGQTASSIEVLIELLPKLPVAVTPKAIDQILAALEGINWRPLDFLSAVVAHLPVGSRRDAVVAEIRSRLNEEEDMESVAAGLFGILPFVPTSERDTSLERLFERIRSTESGNESGRIFIQIAEQTDGVWRQRAKAYAIDAVSQIDDAESWVEVVSRLAPITDAEFHHEVLLRAAKLEDEEDRMRLLDNLAPLLRKEAVIDALGRGRIIGDRVRGDALPEVNDSEVRWRQESEEGDDFDYFYAVPRPDTLAKARAIEFDLERVAGLVEVAPSLTEVERPGVLEEAFAEAMKINDRERRQQALSIVGRALTRVPQERLTKLCMDALRAGGSRRRIELASDLVALRPLIAKVDARSAASIGAMVDEAVRWFP